MYERERKKVHREPKIVDDWVRGRYRETDVGYDKLGTE